MVDPLRLTVLRNHRYLDGRIAGGKFHLLSGSGRVGVVNFRVPVIQVLEADAGFAGWRDGYPRRTGNCLVVGGIGIEGGIQMRSRDVQTTQQDVAVGQPQVIQVMVQRIPQPAGNTSGQLVLCQVQVFQIVQACLPVRQIPGEPVVVQIELLQIPQVPQPYRNPPGQPVVAEV